MRSENKGYKTVILIAALLQTFFSLLLIYTIYKHESLFDSNRLIIIAVIGILCLFADVLAAFVFLENNKRTAILSAILSALMFLGSSSLLVYLQQTTSAQERAVTIEGLRWLDKRTVAFVTYNNDSLEDIDDMRRSTKFGYIDNEASLEGNQLALAAIDQNALKSRLMPYASYDVLLDALLQGKVDVIALPSNYQDIFAENESYADYLSQLQTIYTHTETFEREVIESAQKDVSKEGFTVLIIGNNNHLADSLILVSFQPENGNMTITDIPKDIYTAIVMDGTSINTSLRQSRLISKSCTIDTVESLLGVDVDYYLEVDGEDVIAFVDYLGGIELDSPVAFQREFIYQNEASAEYETMDVEIVSGKEVRDGYQALLLLRETEAMPYGEIDRENNQNAFLKAAIVSALNDLSASEFSDMLDTLEFDTNISEEEWLAVYNTCRGKSLSLTTSRIEGYSSWNYAKYLDASTYLYKTYSGSISDNRDLIRRNLRGESLSGYISSGIMEEDGKVHYYEDERQETAEDLIPRMVKIYDGDDVRAWAAQRSWITLNIIQVSEGNELYHKEFENGQVVKQSVAAGKSSADVTELTIWVIRHKINCKLDIYSGLEECSANNVVPDFVGMTLSQVQAWMRNHRSIDVEIETIENGDKDYDEAYANLVMRQSEEPYTSLSSVTTIVLSMCEAKTVTIDIPTLFGFTSRSAVSDWLNANWGDNYYIYEAYSYDVPAGTIISIRVNGITYYSYDSSPTEKTSSTLYVTISIGPEPVREEYYYVQPSTPVETPVDNPGQGSSENDNGDDSGSGVTGDQGTGEDQGDEGGDNGSDENNDNVGSGSSDGCSNGDSGSCSGDPGDGGSEDNHGENGGSSGDDFDNGDDGD